MTDAQGYVACGGCGAENPGERCIGCLHDFGDPGSAWVHKVYESNEVKKERPMPYELPVSGHRIVEQADMIDGRVAQTVEVCGGYDYVRIVHADEAYGEPPPPAATAPETTRMADRDGVELFVGDVVVSPIDEPYQEHHGEWAEYEIGKAPGGYVLLYVRSQKGCILPFGYTAQYMTLFGDDDLPDLKQLLWARGPVKHPRLGKVLMPEHDAEERRNLFTREAEERRGKAGN